jgi:hypothetical protein
MIWTDSVRVFILNYSWLATPIISVISWLQTWIIAALWLSSGKSDDIIDGVEQSRFQSSFVRYHSHDREDPGVSEESTCNYVAEQRYTGEYSSMSGGIHDPVRNINNDVCCIQG